MTLRENYYTGFGYYFNHALGPKGYFSIQPNLAAAGKPALLYFSADYCAPCRLQQAPIVASLAYQLGETVMIQKYDVSQHPDLASQYKILTLPTTVILDGQGQVRHINYGVTQQAKLEAQLLAA